MSCFFSTYRLYIWLPLNEYPLLEEAYGYLPYIFFGSYFLDLGINGNTISFFVDYLSKSSSLSWCYVGLYILSTFKSNYNDGNLFIKY